MTRPVVVQIFGLHKTSEDLFHKLSKLAGVGLTNKIKRIRKGVHMISSALEISKIEVFKIGVSKGDCSNFYADRNPEKNPA